MVAFLNGEIDAAEAMTYNEMAQVLESENPDTGELYQLSDLNIIDFNEVGTAMLQDHIIARESWLAGDTDGVANEQIATCFLRASFEGWMHCRDNPDECVEIVLDQGTILGEGHQVWMMNEINALIWPSPDGIGILDEALWDQTVQISLDSEILTEEPSDGRLPDRSGAGRARRDRRRHDRRRLREGRGGGHAGRRIDRYRTSRHGAPSRSVGEGRSTCADGLGEGCPV